MKLYETINELKAMHSEAKAALNQTNDKLSDEAIRLKLNANFIKESQSIKEGLKRDLQETLEAKAAELSTTNAANLQSEVTAQVTTLFNDDLTPLSSAVAEKLDLDTIAAQVVNSLSQENKDNYKAVIDEALREDKMELDNLLESSKNEISSAKDNFINSLPTSEVLASTAQRLFYDYLKENTDKLIEQLDYHHADDIINNYLSTNEAFNTELNEHMKIEVRRKASYLLMQKHIETLLQDKAIEVFQEALGYQELLENRYLANLHLAGIMLLSELGSISKVLDALSSVQIAKNRLIALKALQGQTPIQKVFKVV